MAVFDAILVLPAEVSTFISLNATTASSEIALGPQTLVGINADQDLTIRAGAAGSVTAPGTNDFRIPANVTFVFMTSRNAPSFKVYNKSTTTAASVYIQRFSQF